MQATVATILSLTGDIAVNDGRTGGGMPWPPTLIACPSPHRERTPTNRTDRVSASV